jgi:hypothetical protein
MNPNGLFVSSSGNVGIGTSSTGFNAAGLPLVVGSGSGNTGLTIFSGASGAGSIHFADAETTGAGSYSGFINYDHAGNSMQFGTTGATPTERMRITANGNVGVGASPVNLLSVRGNVDFGATGIAYAGMSQYGALTFPRGQIMWSNTNSQNQLYIASNAYSNNNGVFAYRNSGQPSTAIGLDNGGIAFLTAGNGTADAAISWTSAIGISNAGYVTKPSNPAFRAYYSANSTWTLASGATFAFDSTEYNIGSCYNTSNGRFTAPVAGVYQFNFYTIVLGAYTDAAISLRKNGGNPSSGFNVHFTPTQAGSWSNVVYTTSLYLNAGDYVYMTTGTSTVYHGDDWSSFSGYLVG